jgi:hypothetical protein
MLYAFLGLSCRMEAYLQQNIRPQEGVGGLQVTTMTAEGVGGLQVTTMTAEWGVATIPPAVIGAGGLYSHHATSSHRSGQDSELPPNDEDNMSIMSTESRVASIPETTSLASVRTQHRGPIAGSDSEYQIDGVRMTLEELQVFCQRKMRQGVEVIWKGTATDESVQAKRASRKLECMPAGEPGTKARDPRTEDKLSFNTETDALQDLLSEVKEFAYLKEYSIKKMVMTLQSLKLFDWDLLVTLKAEKSQRLNLWVNPGDSDKKIWDLGWWAIRYGIIMTLIIRCLSQDETDQQREDRIRKMTPDGDTSISLKNLYANMLNMYRFNSQPVATQNIYRTNYL